MVLEGERVVDGIRGLRNWACGLDGLLSSRLCGMEKVGWKIYICISESGLLFQLRSFLCR